MTFGFSSHVLFSKLLCISCCALNFGCPLRFLEPTLVSPEGTARQPCGLPHGVQGATMLGFPDNSKVWTRAAFPVEKYMATHSSILAWRIPWTESDTAWQLSSSSSLLWVGSVASVGRMPGQGHHYVNCSFGLLSCQVTSQDKAPSVISRVLKKNNRDSAVASEYELVQLLPGERGQGPGGKADSG